MKSVSLYLFETGLGLNIPDLKEVSGASFPMWGNYSFLDFALANYGARRDLRRTLVLEGEHRDQTSFVRAPSRRARLEVAALTSGLDELIELLEQDPAEILILHSASSVSLFDIDDLLALARPPLAGQIKIAVDGTPADLYAFDRHTLLGVLRDYSSRPQGDAYVSRMLFQDILHSSFDELREIPGEILYQSSLMQLYRENLRLIDRVSSPSSRSAFERLSLYSPERSASHIDERAYVKRSFIAAGVEVTGTVENSVLFPGVTVMHRTKITNSVIMSNNQIGRGASIQNALVLPFRREVKKGSYSIGNEAVIGGAPSSARNAAYGRDIYDGLTVVGMDAEIPRGMVVDPGCYVGCAIPASRLRRIKHLRRGKSLLETSANET